MKSGLLRELKLSCVLIYFPTRLKYQDLITKLSKARTANLLEQNLKNETLIYDLTTNKAFNLNETSTVVYKACNGITTFDELKQKSKFTDDLIYLALDELNKNNLIEDSYVSPFIEMNRRDVIRKVGLASMVMLPVISSLIAPQAAHAASRTIAACQPCTAPNECVSGSCSPAFPGPGSICTNGTNQFNAVSPGNGIPIFTSGACNRFAVEFCCAGNGATFTAPSTCLCNS